MEENISNQQYYGGEPPFTVKSLSEDLERDFFKANNLSFKGGNGLWKVKVSGDFNDFKKAILEYASSRIYMRFSNIKANNAEGTITVELL